MRRELLAWGLLVCSDLPTALLTPSVATLLKFLMRENDDTVVTRYLSEALVLLLRPHTSIVWMMAQLNDFYENHMFIHLFETNWLAQLLVAPESTVNASVGQLFKHRFVASLCRILSRLLPAAVADVCRKCADIVLNGT